MRLFLEASTTIQWSTRVTVSCEDIVGVVGDTLGVFTRLAVDASFAEVTEAPKSEVTTL